MKTSHWINVEPLPTPFPAKRLLHSSRADLVHLHLPAGDAITPHGNDVDVIFHVLQGDGLLTLDAETEQLNAGDSVFIEKNALRGWRAAPDGKGLTLLAVKLLD